MWQMITELTDISELHFKVVDDTPYVGWQYRGCELLVCDSDGDMWQLKVDSLSEVSLVHPYGSQSVIPAIMKDAKGFIAVRTK